MEIKLTRSFLYGVFLHRPLLHAVLGNPAEISEITVPALKVVPSAQDPQDMPCLMSDPTETLNGLIVEGLTSDQLERLRLFATCMGADQDHWVDVPCNDQNGQTLAFGGTGFVTSERSDNWSFETWQKDWAELQTLFAHEIFGRLERGQDRHEIMRLAPFIQSRAWAAVLAKDVAPTTLRSSMAAGPDTEWDQDLPGYDGFFQMKAFEMRRRSFDGTMSQPMQRAGFVAYDAALVLPYDPVNDLVMLVEQMRFGPMLRGDKHPWVFEPAAGLVDAAEDPAETAKREAMEETGLDIKEVEFMTRVYPSPGYSSEFFHCYLATADLAGWTSGVSGLSSESEDIKSHVITLDDALALCDSGEINAAPLVMMLHWVLRHRDRLRRAA